MKNLILTGCLVVGATLGSQAQMSAVEQYNSNSIDPIPRYEHLFKHRVWKRIDLNEKQNKGFFAKGNEITQFIMDAALSGELPVYKNDSLTSQYTVDEFRGNITSAKGRDLPMAYVQDKEYYANEEVLFNGKVYIAAFDTRQSPEQAPADWQEIPLSGFTATLYLPRQMSIIELVEDVIFDKRRSRLYHDIQALTIVIPGSEHVESINFPIGTFKYKDLHRLFLENPEKAIWVNRYNPAENKNFADAFKLRLFRASLYKFENPDDDPLITMYRSRMEAIMASDWWEMELMEKEHNLWEY